MLFFFTIPLPVYQHLFLNSFLIIPSHRVSLPSPWHSPVSISCHLWPITNPPLQLLFVSVVSLSLSGFWNPSTFPSVPLLLLILSCSLSPFCLKVSLTSFYPLCPDFVSTCSSHIFYNIVVKYHFHHAFSVIDCFLIFSLSSVIMKIRCTYSWHQICALQNDYKVMELTSIFYEFRNITLCVKRTSAQLETIWNLKYLTREVSRWQQGCSSSESHVNLVESPAGRRGGVQGISIHL